LALLKEWAYAGVTFALVMATISAYLSGDSHWTLALSLLGLVAVSYFTRPRTRRVWRIRSDEAIAGTAAP
jgi:hypothetical protein